jgi:glycosyltransferase involved in cell wall biosynthesis
MIVRNAATTVGAALDSAAPHITSWVIIDTGSDDGTPDLIRRHMARLGIPGVIHEQPSGTLGDDQTAALALAQGHGDYIWVMDAEDRVVGEPDFSRLCCDVYWLRHADRGDVAWRAQVFRDGVQARYEGVSQAFATWDDALIDVRLQGGYHLENRHRGSQGPVEWRYARDHELLLAAVGRDPKDAPSVFDLAQSFYTHGDFVNAKAWYARRMKMGGWSEEIFYAMYRIADSMANLGAPWADVQDAYLKAWEFQPNRAEPLYAIALHYFGERRYLLAHEFARRAAAIPFPQSDQLCVHDDVYTWRAADMQAVCASWIGKPAESFELDRRLLARPELPDGDRKRIAANRDTLVPTTFYAAVRYPHAIVHSLRPTAGHERQAEVVVSIIAGPDLVTTEQMLNSFLNCCADIARIGRFLMVDPGLSAEDGATLGERYPFLEFTRAEIGENPGSELAHIREEIDGRLWLHLGQAWWFFTPENLLTRLSAVLDAEPEVFQVGINLGDAARLTGTSAAEATVQRATGTGRYVITDVAARGPAMFDTARLDRVGGANPADTDPIAELGRRAAAAGLRTATLDEVLCTAVV